MAIEYFDEMDVDYATSVASRAIESMSKQKVPAIPANFGVWFHYVLGSSPGLRKTIDILLGNKRKFDASINRELYTTYLGAEGGTMGGDSAEHLQGIIEGAQDFLGTAIADNAFQIAALGEVSAQAQIDADPRTIIQSLVSELTKASSRAMALESNFIETASQLEKIKVSLAEAEMRSNTDMLTGLANRRSLDDFLRSSMIRAMETDEPLSVFLIDVDHFKKFNDTHGHLLGDRVLKLVSKVLQDCIREGDLAARFGGEELMAVLPGADLNVCQTIAERVRCRIGEAKLTRRTTGQEIGSVTVSVGVAQFRLAESVEALVERCDRGLYQAKSAGRNRVVTELEIRDQAAA